MIKTAAQILAAVRASPEGEIERRKPGRPPLNRKCSIPGCDRKHKGRGFCSTHHSSWRLFGDPLATARRRQMRKRRKEEGS